MALASLLGPGEYANTPSPSAQASNVARFPVQRGLFGAAIGVPTAYASGCLTSGN